jgi:type-F conjugative transfer system pilin assembly protein TrbC
MAKKELLLPVVIVLTGLLINSSESYASSDCMQAEKCAATRNFNKYLKLQEQNELKAQEYNSKYQSLIKEPSEESLQHARELHKSYLEQLKNIPAFKEPQSKKPESGLMVFVSNSMHENMLKSFIKEAEKYGATLVFRGFIDGSAYKTAEYIRSISPEQSKASVIIHPHLFTEYKVDLVPTIVFAEKKACPPSSTCIPRYDRMSGAVTIKYALSKFAATGDLALTALELLARSRNNGK